MAEFQLSENDFVQANLLVVRKRLRFSGPLLALALALIGASRVMRGDSWVVSLLVWLAIVFALLVSGWLLITYRLKKAYREHTSLHQSFGVTFDEQDIKYSWARGNMSVPWSGIRRYIENEEYFLLFESTMTARVLPKRALSEEETLLIKRKVASLPKR